MVDNVSCLEAGHYALWRDGSFKIVPYWQIDFSTVSIKKRPAVHDEVRAALLDSIKCHFVGDRPVGIFLSGGVDSTVLLALASGIQKSKIKTYSITFEERKFDESNFARIAAKKFGSDHVELKMTRARAELLFEEFLDAVDQPTIDGFNTFCISRLVHDHGGKVVLSGLGADELFGGYPSYRSIPRLNIIGKFLSPYAPACRLLGRMIERRSVSPLCRKFGDYLQEPGNTAMTYTVFRSIFSMREAREVMLDYIPEDIIPSSCGFERNTGPSISYKEQVCYYELSRYMRNQLLRDSDIMSMRHGLELRLPFVDKRLFEVLRKIPPNIRLANRKELLLRSVPELPLEITNRKKHGFVFPFQQWLQEGLGHKLLSYTSKGPWYRSWSLSVLQYWWRSLSK
jgi:asparagine synthase (glutamine-hydrolysing)